MNRPTILVVDTQLDGHHVLWLNMVGAVLLEQGYSVILLVNHNVSEVLRRLDLLDSKFSQLVTVVPTQYPKKIALKRYWNEIVDVFLDYQCQEVIFNNFDTIASKVFRFSVFGIRPPAILRNKMSIIYHRPRPLDQTQGGLGNFWKRLGWRKLVRAGYFKYIWLLDQYLVDEVKKIDGVNCRFIPDPWRISLQISPPAEIHTIDPDQIYLLQYGVGDKRKGSELLLKALLKASNQRVHVWLAGKQKDPEILTLANQLLSRGQLTLLDRYISDEEESWLFSNCTWVTLPYLSHYGSSNLLSKAAKFCKPVIASDFHLIGRNVSTNNLGLVFRDRSVDELAVVLTKLDRQHEQFSVAALHKFADKYSFTCFKAALAANFPKVNL